MSKIIRFIGDVHGKYTQYKHILKESPHQTIQVGDMGVGFFKWPHGEPLANPPHALMVEKEATFIRGNHDNPKACERQSQWIRDGHIDDLGIMYIGGALSIDKAWRIEGFSWWGDEELSIEALNQLVDRYIEHKPWMMVTHECPELVAQEVARTAGVEKLDPRFASRTRQALQAMWSNHQPKIWVFGHWHKSFDHTLDGTRFICLNELEWKDVEVG